MAASTNPIFCKSVRSSIGTALTAANTNTDGTGTVATIFTAGVDGSFIGSIRLKALGSNVATVARFFTNNGATNTVATNNSLLTEVTLQLTVASPTSGLPEYDIPINRPLEGSFTILMTLGTAVASGWIATVFGGNY